MRSHVPQTSSHKIKFDLSEAHGDARAIQDAESEGWPVVERPPEPSVQPVPWRYYFRGAELIGRARIGGSAGRAKTEAEGRGGKL